MFGHNQHQDNQSKDQNTIVPEPAADAVLTQTPEPPVEAAPPVVAPSAPVVAHDEPSPTPSASKDDQNPKSEVVDMGDSDLINIKQQALHQLSPLVNHLDQSPEERFKTLMMIIQASDDQSLVRSAYDIAKDISDEKAKAQALLDIINEINYFTQQSK